MFSKIVCCVMNICFVALFARRSLAFRVGITRLRHAQLRKMLSIIQKNRKTEFGVAHGFSAIRDYDDFATRVPLSDYKGHAAYISMIAGGRDSILTRERVLRLMPSSGSSSPSKYIPYTKSLKHEFQEGLAPWIVDLFIGRKRLLAGKAYWAITPSPPVGSTPTSRVPIGFDDDSSYFGIFAQMILKRLLAVPEEVSRIGNNEASRYVTLLFLLKEKNLRFVSIWNPIFLSLMLEPLNRWALCLVEDIENGTISSPAAIEPFLKDRLMKKIGKNPVRARELKDIFRQRDGGCRPTVYEKIWPYLSLVSCWADGPSSGYIAEIRKYFPSIEAQPKGLLATEGCVSLPLLTERGAVLAARSHFFEFIEIADGRTVRLAHELTEGRSCSVVITTSGGLYRYRLGDIIKVVGFRKDCPIVCFVGKEDKISDLHGEKLNEYHVETVLQEVFNRNGFMPDFSLLAPERHVDGMTHYYTVFLEGTATSVDTLERVLSEIETGLCKNFHYNYCRSLGQLSRPRLFVINSGGRETYFRVSGTLHNKQSVMKPPALSKRIGWSREFAGKYVALDISGQGGTQ